VVALDGLAYPTDAVAPPDAEAQHGAVALFAQTARMVAPDFALTPATLPGVIRICRLVDGLPLGIELAANWVRVLSCAEIAAEIAQSLDFLVSEADDLTPRQRSLRAVLASSWNLLTPAEQQSLRRLAVFSGSFTRAAAAAVADVPLPRLASLINKSLVRRLSDGDTAGADVRYELPQPLRQFAAEALERAGETAPLAERAARYYLDAVAARLDDLRGAQQQAALDAIEAELDAVQAAWRWACAAGAYPAIGAAAQSLFHFYDMRSRFQEGWVLFTAAADAVAALRDDPAAALVWCGARSRRGRPGSASRWAARSRPVRCWSKAWRRCARWTIRRRWSFRSTTWAPSVPTLANTPPPSAYARRAWRLLRQPATRTARRWRVTSWGRPPTIAAIIAPRNAGTNRARRWKSAAAIAGAWRFR
jgi:hypothetical protein